MSDTPAVQSEPAMRVLHVLHHSFHYQCGYRTRTEYTVRAQRDHGIEPLVLTASDHENGARVADGLDRILLRQSPVYCGTRRAGARELNLMRILQRQVQCAITELRPDVVHAHSPVLVALPALIAARRAGLPFVYEVRDLWENASVALGKFSQRSLAYRLARMTDTYVLRRADAVVAICNSLRHELAGRMTRTDVLFVAPNGVSAEAFAAAAPASPASRWYIPGCEIVGYAGMFHPYEGVDLLIDAFPSILRRRPQARLLIAGQGPDEARLRDQIRQLNLGEFVTLAASVPHREMRQFYAACDVLVYPRRSVPTTQLTTPLKPLEAMAMGRAVIGSDVAAMRELIREGETGLLFAAGNRSALAETCCRLLADPGVRARLGDAAAEWTMSNRQWQSTAAVYRDVYRCALTANASQNSGRRVA